MFPPFSVLGNCLWDSAASPCSYHVQLNASKPHSATAVWLGQSWIHYHPLPAFLLSPREAWNFPPKWKKQKNAQVLCKLDQYRKKAIPMSILTPCHTIHVWLQPLQHLCSAHLNQFIFIVTFSTSKTISCCICHLCLCNTITHRARLQPVSQGICQCRDPAASRVFRPKSWFFSP